MFLIYQPEDGQWKGPKHVVVLYVINYIYLCHRIVVLDRSTHSNLVYYKHNGDDEPYDLNSEFSAVVKEVIRKVMLIKDYGSGCFPVLWNLIMRRHVLTVRYAQRINFHTALYSTRNHGVNKVGARNERKRLKVTECVCSSGNYLNICHC